MFPAGFRSPYSEQHYFDLREDRVHIGWDSSGVSPEDGSNFEVFVRHRTVLSHFSELWPDHWLQAGAMAEKRMTSSRGKTRPYTDAQSGEHLFRSSSRQADADEPHTDPIPA
jgi:hypothetical protein